MHDLWNQVKEAAGKEPTPKLSGEGGLKYRKIIHVKTILATIALISIGCTASTVPQQLSIATGSAGWEYNRTGDKICSKLNESGRFRCKAIVTRGSLQNIELLQNGKVNLALSQSDMIPDDDVDFISLKNLSRQSLYVFVRKDSDISSIHDLTHRRINVGPIGSGLRGTMNNVLKATGVVPSEVSDVTASQESSLLCRNQTDAISFVLDLDAPQVEKIEKACPMRRLGFSRNTLEEVMRGNAAYYPINFGSSDREDAYAVGLHVDLVTYKDALSPEDRQLIVDSLQARPQAWRLEAPGRLTADHGFQFIARPLLGEPPAQARYLNHRIGLLPRGIRASLARCKWSLAAVSFSQLSCWGPSPRVREVPRRIS